jgi:hypothetical protein
MTDPERQRIAEVFEGDDVVRAWLARAYAAATER